LFFPLDENRNKEGMKIFVEDPCHAPYLFIWWGIPYSRHILIQWPNWIAKDVALKCSPLRHAV